MTHPLGRKPFVPDDRDWPVALLKSRIDMGTSVPLSWSVPSILDQGDTGHCVGFGTAGACNADDANHVASGLTDADAHALYYAAKVIEGDPMGEDGAYVRDGLKAAKDAGLIDAYSLLRTKDEVQDWLEHHGPVVVGSDWLTGMDSPDAQGFVTAGGRIRGGHCYYANGDTKGLDCVNSWGDGWAKGGRFYFDSGNFDELMGYDFESWAVTQAAPTPPPDPEPTPEPIPTPPFPRPTWWETLTALLAELLAWAKHLFDDRD